MPSTDPTPIPADETSVDELLTDAEWDALGRAFVSTWDTESRTSKRIWRGFSRNLATGYRLGLTAGRTAAAADTLREAATAARQEPFGPPQYWQRHQKLAVARWLESRADQLAENGADRVDD